MIVEDTADSYSYSSGGSNSNDASNDVYIKFMFIGSIFFLVVPTFLTLYQLQREVKMWLNDSNMRQIIEPWLRVYVRFLYFLSIVFGGSFSAIDLCNSNLFQFQIFYMNLSREYKQIFKNKRVLSIVIFENIPQFVIQILYSFIYNNISINIITIIAMIFSFLSIILTFFEFSTKQYLFKTENGIIIKMEINSKEIEIMTRTQFIKRIEHKRYSISNEIAKILSIDFNTIELLKPIPSSKGVILIFHIQTHVENAKKLKVFNTLSSDENNQRISQRLKQTYKISQIPYIVNIHTQSFGVSTNPGTAATTGLSINTSSGTSQVKGNNNYNYNYNQATNMMSVPSASTEPQRRTETAQTGMLSTFELTPNAVMLKSASMSPSVEDRFDDNSNDEIEIVGNLPYTMGRSKIETQTQIQSTHTITNQTNGEQTM